MYGRHNFDYMLDPPCDDEATGDEAAAANDEYGAYDNENRRKVFEESEGVELDYDTPEWAKYVSWLAEVAGDDHYSQYPH